MDCKCAFIVNVSLMDEDEVFSFIDELGVECGITDENLYYGLNKRETDGDFSMARFVYESLSNVIGKADKLVKLKNKYKCRYILNVKFSDIEEEIANNQSFILDDNVLDFIKKTDTYYNLNDGYFEG